MEFDYFSVEAILAENQKIQCTFKHEIPGMGHIGGGSERDIAALSKIQIPIWLAYTIIYSFVEHLFLQIPMSLRRDNRSDWAEFNIPIAFSSKVRNALNAEPCSVRLSNLVGAGNLWYGFGKTIMDILSDEQANEISEMLTKAFKGRIPEVIDQAQHFAALSLGGPLGHSAQAFREGLDTTERELFSFAQESAKRTKKWYEDSDRH